MIVRNGPLNSAIEIIHTIYLYSVCVFCFFFYLTVLIACMIGFYYNVCDCHAFIKGNLLTYLHVSHAVVVNYI